MFGKVLHSCEKLYGLIGHLKRGTFELGHPWRWYFGNWLHQAPQGTEEAPGLWFGRKSSAPRPNRRLRKSFLHSGNRCWLAAESGFLIELVR